MVTGFSPQSNHFGGPCYFNIYIQLPFMIGCKYKGLVISVAFLPLKTHVNEMRQRIENIEKKH